MSDTVLSIHIQTAKIQFVELDDTVLEGTVIHGTMIIVSGTSSRNSMDCLGTVFADH